LENGSFSKDFYAFSSVVFVDDSEKNCIAVAESLKKLKVSAFSIWHYHYAETHLPFCLKAQVRSAIQEYHLINNDILLSDEEADTLHFAQGL